MNRAVCVMAAVTMMSVATGFAEAPVQVPAIHHTAASANLISRAELALRNYVAACSKGDGEALGRAVTSDALVEYALNEPGAYLSVDATALSPTPMNDSSRMQPGPAHVSDLWIFPTNDARSVFAKYTVRDGAPGSAHAPSTAHLALIEMHGDRIFRMRDFTADGSALAQPESSVGTRAITYSCAGTRP